MKILVVGGTGFIGSAIVEALKQKGFDTINVMSRYKGLIGDITKPESLPNEIRDFETVIQCVQFPNSPVQNYKRGFTFEKFDAQGTENLCRHLKGGRLQRIIYLSGAGVDEKRVEPWFRAKWRAETAIKTLGVDYVILRPSWVYGPGDRSLNKFISFAKYLPVMPVIGSGNNRVSPLFIKDLAQVCAKSVDLNEIKNRIFEIGGPQILTMNEIQKTVLDVFGKRKPMIHLPIFFMKIVGAAMSLFLSNPPISAEAIDFVTEDVPVDSSAASKVFNINFKNLKSTLQEI